MQGNAMARQQPIEQARRWWKQHVDAHDYVVSPDAVRSAAVARVLRQEGLVMDVAGRRVWILTAERPTDRRAVFLTNYWPVVAMVLTRYAPAGIAGIGAVRLQLENFSPPEEALAYHSANRSEYSLPLEAEFILRLKPRERIESSNLAVVDAPGARVPALGAAEILTTLTERDLATGVESVSAWLRHLVIRTPELDAAVNPSTRAVTLQRLADLAGELKNEPLARQLDRTANRLASRSNSPARTGIGTRVQVPPVLQQAARATGSPWLDEQAMRFARQAADVETLTSAGAKELAAFPWRTLRAAAEKVKAYDAYHSTTMEGYRISREISDAIIRGEPLPGGPRDIQTLRAAMAIQGYSIAFNEVLARARNQAPVDTDLILDLYEALFRPSVDAGVTDSAALRSWRNTSVGLRGWRHVPPNAKKIPDLIAGLERFAARKDLSTITRAMLVHLEFVTIHPFLDGNGRLGRLLMNHVLLSGGLPWVTVRSDERVPFFRAIEQAQADTRTTAFILFLWHLIRQSALSLRGKKPARARRKSSPRP